MRNSKQKGFIDLLDLKELQESIANEDIKKTEDLLRMVVEDKKTEAYEYLLEAMQKTNNAIIRNVIAMALSDVGYQDAVDTIIKLLNSERTEGCKGTLLYSLQTLDYMEHIEFIFQLTKIKTWRYALRLIPYLKTYLIIYHKL